LASPTTPPRLLHAVAKQYELALTRKELLKNAGPKKQA
jgi:hypothetical protein